MHHASSPVVTVRDQQTASLTDGAVMSRVVGVGATVVPTTTAMTPTLCNGVPDSALCGPSRMPKVDMAGNATTPEVRLAASLVHLWRSDFLLPPPDVSLGCPRFCLLTRGCVALLCTIPTLKTVECGDNDPFRRAVPRTSRVTMAGMVGMVVA